MTLVDAGGGFNPYRAVVSRRASGAHLCVRHRSYCDAWACSGGSGTRSQYASHVTSLDPMRFGQLIQARRRFLGLTAVQVAEAGGPSKPTMHRLESGKASKPDTATLTKLDHALRWSPGSAAQALDGGDPVPLEDDRRMIAPSLDRPIVATEYGVMLSMETLGALTEAVQSLRSADGGEVDSAIEDLSSIADRLLRAWITAQAESWKAQGTLQSNAMLVTRMLGSSLHRAPGPSATEADVEDIGYLRWLIGRATDPSDDEITRWSDRWERRQR